MGKKTLNMPATWDLPPTEKQRLLLVKFGLYAGYRIEASRMIGQIAKNGWRVPDTMLDRELRAIIGPAGTIDEIKEQSDKKEREHAADLWKDFYDRHPEI